MVNVPYISRVTYILIALLLLVVPTGVWSMNLPLSRDLNVRLSSLSSQGQLQTVSEITAKTDSLGKITFNFPTVPSATTTPFLHIQIMDGATVLRQTIVPSPQAGAHVDIGISEVTDLQARSLLEASAISGRLTPLHLLVAQALLRTPTISVSNAESVGVAIVAGADAIAGVLATDGLTSSQLSTFMDSLSKGLVNVAAMYRKSVDEAVVFDQKVEAYKRGEAYAILLQSLITAGSDAGINLETICTAFAAAGKATEIAIESNPEIDLVTRAGMRIGFVTGILNLSNYKMVHELVNSFSCVGIAPPKFVPMFDVFDLVLLNTTNRLKGADGELLEYSLLNDLQALRVREFNALAIQDVLLLKVGMEGDSFSNLSTEAAILMLDITSRMASMGGVMVGMTPEILMGILGRPINPPVVPLSAQRAVASSAYIPTLNPYELAAWSYIYQESSFIYTPIPGLIDQLVTKPTFAPTVEKLAEPYKSLALLMYDLGLVSSLRWQDQQDVDAYITANPLNPPRWYSLASVYQILENNRQRLNLVRQHMSGVSPQTQNALIYLLSHSLVEF
ncbi:hypothetical protein [Trichlorobacter lovleyi]|uniref:hypothetical protein n=1 Tax=Trichlorobacter lovleyi TaxID=313985 RepID=UPI003D0B7481